MMPIMRLPRVTAIVILLSLLNPVWAQEDVPRERDFELAAADTAAANGDGGFQLDDASFAGNPIRSLMQSWPEDLVIAPIPGRSPQLGWMLTVVGGYFLGARDEEELRPSVVGGFAMGSENNSSAYGAGFSLHLLDDRLRLQGGAGSVDVRYRFYGIGNEAGDRGVGVDIRQDGPLYFASAKWRVWNQLYAGLGYLAGNVRTRLRLALPPGFPPFEPTVDIDIGAVSVPLQFDSRDHEQFPRSGWLADAEARVYRRWAGSDFETETVKISVNHYRPMRREDTLALRAFVRTTGTDAPFFLLSSFGGGPDLRGYPAGRYRDRMMYALQGEYRWKFNDRWIFTGFAGVGEVGEGLGDFGENFLPAAGVGGRFVLSQKHRVSLSADVAVGKDGPEFYFGIGEAF